MLELIEEIRYCIANNKLRIALGMALTLPDICGNVEYKNLKVSERYIKWCEKYLNNDGFITVSEEEDNNSVIIDPLHCYKLRCAYLHSGNSDLNQNKNDDFPNFELRLSSTNDSGVYIESYTKCDEKVENIVIDVRHLCIALCCSAENYYNNHEKNDFIEHSFKILDVQKALKELNQRLRS